MEAVILAGGAGTRLQSVVSDVPKPMADIRGRPFLDYLVRELAAQGTERIVLSVCHKREVIRDYFGERFLGIPVAYSVEEEPLGTGGAIYQSLGYVRGADALVLNGDTFFKLDFRAFMDRHAASGCDITIGLKSLKNCDRYGTVTVTGGRVAGFEEKAPGKSGYINAGVYGIKTDLRERFPRPGKFSFEADLLQKEIGRLKVCPFAADGYFIDIGVPEDYLRAQRELSPPSGEKA